MKSVEKRSADAPHPSHTIVVALLAVGSFLEYFDLCLYVHIAGMLNRLFFPPHNFLSSKMLAAFVFCSTYILRPFGAFGFGYLGDKAGRKAAVITTTLTMACACLTLSLLPTYAQIGIAASWLVVGCRFVQGLSVLGERLAAELYLTELARPPMQYVLVGLVAAASELGALCAVGAGKMIVAQIWSWRVVFGAGALVALVGALSRTRLASVSVPSSSHALVDPPSSTLGASLHTSLAFFGMQCISPVGFYLLYVHCGSLLKEFFGCSETEVLQQNFWVGCVQLGRTLGLALASGIIHPLRLLKIRTWAFAFFALLAPWLLHRAQTVQDIWIFQVLGVLSIPSCMPAGPILYKHFPKGHRFKYTGTLFAVSRALAQVAASFGLIYATQQVGHWGIWLLFLPALVAYGWGLQHFIKLERGVGR